MTRYFERLQLAMSINASFQANIRHADTKIGMLAVACSAMVTAMLTRADAVRDAVHRADRPLEVALGVWLLLLAYTAVQMARAVRPHIDPPAAGNHFALLSSPAAQIHQVRPDILCDEASALGRTLAGIAARKFRAVTATLYATVGLAVLTAVCLGLTTMAS